MARNTADNTDTGIISIVYQGQGTYCTNNPYNDIADTLAKKGSNLPTSMSLSINHNSASNNFNILWDNRLIDKPIRKFFKETNKVKSFKQISASQAFFVYYNK